MFTASDLSSITSHINNWVLFFLWLHLFILSGVISLLISSSILGTYRLGEFLCQCPIFLPFHTVHGVLKSGILKWFANPFSSGEWWLCGSGATKRRYPHVQDQEQQLCFAGAAVKRYPTSKVRETPVRPHSHQRCSEGSNKPFAHQDPGNPQIVRQNCV